MRASRVVTAVIVVFCAASSLSADILRNGGFESVTGAPLDQGYLPNDWFQVGLPNIGADTYSNDGSYGLTPGAYGNFVGVSAYEGIRFVAGAASNESFGQILTDTLTAGQTYELAAMLHGAMRWDLTGAGGYDVCLAATPSGGGAVWVATLGPTVGPEVTLPQWESASASFVAPENASELPVIVFIPFKAGTDGYGAYPGIDALSLTLVPEPATMALLGLGLVGLVTGRRRT